MSYFFIICFAFSLLFSSLLFSKKRKKSEDLFLGLLFSCITINCLFVFLFSKSEGSFYLKYFSELNYSLQILYGPLLWLYTRALTSIDFKFHRLEILHFLPFFLFLAAVYLPLISNFELKETSQFGYPLPKLLITPFYLVAVIVLIRRYQRRYHQTYAEEMQANLVWLNWIIIGALVLWLMATVSYVYNLYAPEDNILIYDYYTLTFLGSYLFALTFVAIRNTQMFVSEENVEEIKKVELESVEEEIPETCPATPVFIEEDLAALKASMTEKEHYLDSDISLNKLAELTGIPSYRLTKALKAEGTNFFDYINNLRIEKVKDLLKAGKAKELSILGIATEAGFNSKASFNRVFKKTTGMTPSAYLKDLE